MTDNHVVDHVFVVRTSFIRCTPSSVSKLKSSISHQCFNLSLFSLVKSVIPHREELHFDIRENSVRVLKQFVSHTVQNFSHVCMLNPLVCSSEVLVYRFEPSHIVMSVCNEMNIQWFLLLVLAMLKLLFIRKSFLCINLLLPFKQPGDLRMVILLIVAPQRSIIEFLGFFSGSRVPVSFLILITQLVQRQSRSALRPLDVIQVKVFDSISSKEH